MNRHYHTTLMADFETSGEAMAIKNNRADVFLWGYIDLSKELKEDNITRGTLIKEFFVSIQKDYQIKKQRTNVAIYFHNLSWDGFFILNYLMENNIPYKSVIDGKKKFYQIEFKINSKLHLTFFCSYLNTMSAVANLPGATKTQGDFDYNKDYTGFKISDFSKLELNYLDQDILTVARILKPMIERNGGEHYLTASQAAYKEMSSTSLNEFDNPDLNYGQWLKLSAYYRGGYTNFNPSFTNKKVFDQNLYYIDITSSYPFIMKNYELPIGFPQYGITLEDKRFPLKLIHITINLAKIKRNKIAWIGNTGARFLNAEYTPIIGGEKAKELYITEQEWIQLQKDYDVVDYQINEVIGFKSKRGEMYDYIEKYFTAKNEAKTPFDKMIAKLFLNSTYGKFGQNPIQDNVKFLNNSWEGELIQGKKEDVKRTKYIPKAIFITAFARLRVIELINNVIGKNRFIYCDTDSIMTTMTLEEVEAKIKKLKLNHTISYNKKTSQLGDWGLEFIAKRFKILGPKKYMLEGEDGEFKIAFNGLRDKYDKIKNFEDMVEEKTFENIKRRLIIGGPYLKKSEFTMKLKEREDY